MMLTGVGEVSPASPLSPGPDGSNSLLSQRPPQGVCERVCARMARVHVFVLGWVEEGEADDTNVSGVVLLL